MRSRLCSPLFRLCTRAMIVLVMLSGASCGAADRAPDSPAIEKGLLRVHPFNPRYFTDNSGKAIYLGGHQIFVDLQDNTFSKHVTYNHQAKLDWPSYLRFAKERNLNYVRNWIVMSTGCGVPIRCATASPMPYKRVFGYGNAKDGKPKFDLYQFDEQFFQRLRARMIDARDNGIYVSIMLYDVYSFANFSETLEGMWGGNVFNRANNINGIHADTNGDGWGLEFFTAPSFEITALQRNYVRKVIDTVSDLDNVFFEIANEVGALQWQYEMLDFVKRYQASKRKQHLVLLSPGGLSAAHAYTNATKDEIVWTLADVYAAANDWTDYLNDPPVNDNGKPGILDRDHVEPRSGAAPLLPWKAFTRGYHYNLYDEPFETGADNDFTWELARYNIGAVVNYANNVFVDLAAMVPRGELSSTRFALANPGAEYLIVQPGSGPFTVAVPEGIYRYEWFDPNTAVKVTGGVVSLRGGSATFTPPGSGAAVLYLVKNAW